MMVVAAMVARAQTAAPVKHVNIPKIAPRAEDVGSIDGMMKAYYEVISGPAGQARQWGRDHTLYIPGMHFVAMSVDKNGKPQAEVVDHQQYVDRTDPQVVSKGFYEREIHRTTHRFGNIAHVFSTYESRHAPGEKPFARGINSMQLAKTGQSWKMISILWDTEREGNPMPERYLTAAPQTP